MGDMVREFPRYRIADTQAPISGRIDDIRWPFKLATFGNGGCGFHCVIRPPHLVIPKDVECQFESRDALDESIRVHGRLIYVTEVELEFGKKTFFYGIEFDRDHRNRVEPVAKFLEKLKNQGKISNA